PSRESDIAKKVPSALSNETRPMKAWIPVALLVVMSPVALAKPTPIELPAPIVKAGIMHRSTHAAVQEQTGSVWPEPEREYFEATESPINAFPGRIEPVLFSKVQLAQSC